MGFVKETTKLPFESLVWLMEKAKRGGLVTVAGPITGIVYGAIEKQASLGLQFHQAPLLGLTVLIILSHHLGRQAAYKRGDNVSWRTTLSHLRVKIFAYSHLYVAASAAAHIMPQQGGLAAYYGIVGWMVGRELDSLFKSERELSGIAPDSTEEREITGQLGRQGTFYSPPGGDPQVPTLNPDGTLTDPPLNPNIGSDGLPLSEPSLPPGITGAD
jgi:hypothetical protein